MKWLQAQIMLSITRAPTCVRAGGEISIDTQIEEERINTAASFAFIYTSNVWGSHNRSSVCRDLPHMCHNLSTHIRACMFAAWIVDNRVKDINYHTLKVW